MAAPGGPWEGTRKCRARAGWVLRASAGSIGRRGLLACPEGAGRRIRPTPIRGVAGDRPRFLENLCERAIWTPPGYQARMEVLDFRLRFYIRPLNAGLCCLRALMDSAGPRLVQQMGFLPHTLAQVWRTAVLPVGHHLVSYLVQPCGSDLLSLDPKFEPIRLSSGRLAPEIPFIATTVGQQRPNRSRVLVGQRHGGDIRRPTLEQLRHPCRGVLCVSESRPGAVD